MKMFSSGRPHLAAPTAAETAGQNFVKHIFGNIMMENNFENFGSHGCHGQHVHCGCGHGQDRKHKQDRQIRQDGQI